MNAKAIKSVISILTLSASLSAHAWSSGFGDPVSDLKNSVSSSHKYRNLGRVFNEWKECSRVEWKEVEMADPYQGVSITCKVNFDKAKSILKNPDFTPDSIIYRFIYAREGKDGGFRLDKTVALTCWSDKKCHEETHGRNASRDLLNSAYQNTGAWSQFYNLYESNKKEAESAAQMMLMLFMGIRKSAGHF
jgi:hypothetical protein